MTKKILVTGGDGFIGTYVIKLLSEKYGSDNILSMDNHTTYLDLIPKEELTFLLTERQKIVGVPLAYCDINDKTLVKKAFDMFKPTHVLHLAAFPRAKVVDKNPSYASETLISGLLNILENCSTVEHFVYISSSMVYGDFDHPISENELCNPKGTYGILKLAGEQLVKDWASKMDKNYTILRPSAVYGPLDVQDRVVSKFFEAAMKDEALTVHGAEQLLDFTYVEDLASGICATIETHKSFGHTFNMSRGSSRTLLDAAECITKIVGAGRINIQSKHPMYPSRDSLDCSKAYELLDFTPTTDIEVGFLKYYDWLK
jgi:nucleoside-diphosphate-sugar epimerase